MNIDSQLNLTELDELVVMAFFTFLEAAPLSGLDGDIGIIDLSLEQRASKVNLDQARKGGSKQSEEHLITDYVENHDYFNETRHAIYTGLTDVHYAGGHRLMMDFMRGETWPSCRESPTQRVRIRPVQRVSQSAKNTTVCWGKRKR